MITLLNTLIEIPPVPPPPTTNSGDFTTKDELSQGSHVEKEGSVPVATCHGRDWYIADTETTRNMKKVPMRQWAVKDAFWGESVSWNKSEFIKIGCVHDDVSSRAVYRDDSDDK